MGALLESGSRRMEMGTMGGRLFAAEMVVVHLDAEYDSRAGGGDEVRSHQRPVYRIAD